MTATALTFDRAQHRYTLDGRELLSVTAVLLDAGLIDGRWFNEDAATRGTYVHAALALLHEQDLDAETLDDRLRSYVDAYQRFLAESGFVVDAWEERVCDPVLGYAGTLDLRGRFPATSSSDVNILDIKTGGLPSWVGYQTAGYARALSREFGPPRWRWCLQLSDDGTYRLHPLRSPSDDRVFVSALTVAKAKRGWL